MRDSLRTRTIRLAARRPELRAVLLPLLRTAGDVIPFRSRIPANPNTLLIRGRKYVLSTHSGNLAGDLLETPEEESSEGGARVFRGPVADPWKYLWVHDTEKRIVAMWRVTDGNSKEWGDHGHFTHLMVELSKKNQLNRVTHAEFLDVEREMNAREEENIRSLEQWVEDNKTDTQRQVDELVQEYFDTRVRPAMDRALADIEAGATPFGFRANPDSPFTIERQAKSYATGNLYQKLFTLDQINAYVESRGVNLESIDIQATEWAQGDVWLAYARSALR
jgi:hypothetical protein